MKTKVACSTFYCKHFDFEKSESAIVQASASGNFQALKLLIASGYPVSARVANFAAGKYPLCLEALIRAGCPIDAQTMMFAVKARNAACVKILIANGCPVTQEHYDFIDKNRYCECDGIIERAFRRTR